MNININNYENIDGFIYLIVPENYHCIYDKLLILMSDLGTKLLQDCNTECDKRNVNLIRCWNMFQTACSAYANGDTKKSDLIIHYINVQLDLQCEDYDTIFELFYIDINEPLYGGTTIGRNRNAIFVIKNIDKLVPNSLTITYLNNNIVIAKDLSLESPQPIDIGHIIAVNGKSYKWQASVKGLNGNIYTSRVFTVNAVQSDRIIYYGDFEREPSIAEIDSGKQIDYNVDNKFLSPFNNLVNYVAIPKGLTIDTIENAGFRRDWLYNDNTKDNQYKRKNIMLNNKHYILWWTTVLMPLMSDVEVVLKEGDWDISTIIYFGDSVVKPNITDVEKGLNIDSNEVKEFEAPFYNAYQFIALPKGIVIGSIDNSSLPNNWLYNQALNIDFYTREDITIKGDEYVLWYCNLNQPLGGNVRVIIN